MVARQPYENKEIESMVARQPHGNKHVERMVAWLGAQSSMRNLYFPLGRLFERPTCVGEGWGRGISVGGLVVRSEGRDGGYY